LHFQNFKGIMFVLCVIKAKVLFCAQHRNFKRILEHTCIAVSGCQGSMSFDYQVFTSSG